MNSRADLVVVGAGIIGLATARSLSQLHPNLRIVIVDKESAVGMHQTGHNSGVLHAGVYYPPGSRKATLCRQGKAQMEQFARDNGIPYERCGKLIVASNNSEIPALEELERRARVNGVEGIEMVGPERIHELEPHVSAVRGLWSPGTGIIDFSAVATAMADELRRGGVEILLGSEVRALRDGSDERIVVLQDRSIATRDLVVCAGLQADRLARMTGTKGPRIVPFRGDYYALTSEARRYVRGLIYPVPDPRFPFLGVHFTKRIDGEVWAGPNAVLAFAREGYRRRDINLRDVAGTLTYRGFLRVASHYPTVGMAEMYRDFSKRAFLGALQKFVPSLTSADLVPGPSGVRAQAIDRAGNMVDDFAVGGSAHVLHVQNAPSPAATASLAIGEWLARLAEERFGLNA